MRDEFYKTISCTVEDTEITGVFDSGFFNPAELSNIPHRHKGMELHASYARYTIEDVTGKSVDVCADAVALVPENFYHNCIASEQTSDKFIFRIVLSRAKDYDGKMPIYDILQSEFSKKELLSLRVKNACAILEGIKNELVFEKTGSKAAASALFSQFAVSLSRASTDKYTTKVRMVTKTKSLSDDMISRNEKVEHFFNRITEQNFKADVLAGELGLSIRQLNRIFKSYYGASFGQILAETRLVRAEKLLSSTDIPIEDIAFEVGYRSLSAFLTAFKKRYGTTPGKYRRGARMS